MTHAEQDMKETSDKEKQVESYCEICGQKMIAVPSERFSRSTGERLDFYRCSSGLCGHNGVSHQYFDSGFIFTTTKCRKCDRTLEPY